MTIEGFTPIGALIGGALIGGAAALLLLFNGRIAGVSGIVGGLVPPRAGDAGWRMAFVAGLGLGAFAYGLVEPATRSLTIEPSIPVLIVGGLLVGIGTRLGGGCTSGHGVCGLARLSPRSLVATAVFMASAGIVVFVARHVVGG